MPTQGRGRKIDTLMWWWVTTVANPPWQLKLFPFRYIIYHPNHENDAKIAKFCGVTVRCRPLLADTAASELASANPCLWRAGHSRLLCRNRKMKKNEGKMLVPVSESGTFATFTGCMYLSWCNFFPVLYPNLYVRLREGKSWSQSVPTTDSRTRNWSRNAAIHVHTNMQKALRNDGCVPV